MTSAVIRAMRNLVFFLLLFWIIAFWVMVGFFNVNAEEAAIVFAAGELSGVAALMILINSRNR